MRLLQLPRGGAPVWLVTAVVEAYRPGVRILLTHVYSWPEVRRGGERYVHELGAALVESGHSVRILSTAPEPHRDEVLGVPTRRVKRRERLRRFGEIGPEMLFGAQALTRAMAQRFDVWHAFGTSDAAAAALLSRVRPWPRTRSVYTDLGGSDRPYRAARPDHRIFELVVRHVDTYLCLSEAMQAKLISGYGRAGLVVGGGVDLRRFRPAAQRAEHPTLLYSGTMDEPRKNVALLVAAFDRLLDDWPDARLQLSGPGDATTCLAGATDRVRAATSVLGRGAIGDVERLYGEAWATVLPSTDEAFGLVLVESLACGTPIVALAGGGGPAEIVTPDTGVLAAYATPDALATACATALWMASRGAETSAVCRAAAQQYGWVEAVVPRLEHIYSGQVAERVTS